MARLVIGVDVVGHKDVEALARGIDRADKSLQRWINTSSKASEDRIVKVLGVMDARFTKLQASASAAAKSLDAFLDGKIASHTAKVYGHVEAVKLMEQAYQSLIATQAKQTMMEMPGAQRLLAEKKAIEANISAYQKLQSMGAVNGGYNRNNDYSYKLAELKKIEELDAKIAANEAKRASMQAKNEAEIIAALKAEEKARQEVALATIKQFEAEQATRKGPLISSHADLLKAQSASQKQREIELKKIEELDAKIAANEAKRASMQAKNEAEIIAALKAEEKARQEVALATIKQFEAEKLLSGTGPTNISKGLKSAVVYAPVGAETAKDAVKGTAALNQLGDAWDNAGKKSRTFHDLLRGASGAMGTLWLTYGQILPMLAGFATVSAGMKTFSIGSELDYTARSIEVLSYGYKTLESNVDLANKSLLQTKEALLGIQDSPFSANKLGEGVLEFARAGYKDLEENIKGVDAASKFAYIGQMDLAKAIELVVGEMSAFKGVTADAALNIMATVADKTSINLQQMGDAFKNATSLGTVLGLKFNDVATAIGIMGQAGIRGATAGAALNTMMYKLIAPTEKARKQMDALGISFQAFDNKGNIKSIREISFELANMTKDLKPNEIGKVFESMVGLRGVKALGALVQMAKESSKEFDDLSTAVQNSGEYLDGYFKLLEKSGKVQFDLLKSNVSNIFASAYTESEPAIIDALKSLNDLAKDKSVIEFVGFLTTSMANLVKIVADGTRAVIDFGAALNNVIPIKGLIEATLAGVAYTIERIANLAKLAKELQQLQQQQQQQGKGSISFNPVKAWDEYSRSVDNLFSGKGIKDSMAEAALETAKLANQAKNAKAELVEINSVKVQVFSEEEANKLGTIEEYFDQIRDKIIDANKTPLQLIDAKVQQDTQAYFATLVQGGMSLDKMIELTETYKHQIEEAGGAGETAAEKIEKIGKSLKDAGGEEAKIKQLIDNLQGLAEAANAKELEKINKQIISGLKKEWQSYADKVIDIQNTIVDNQRSLAQELRSIDQSNMTGMALWKDKKREADEYKQAAIEAGQKAVEALKAGDKVTAEGQYKLAEEYFKQSVQAAKALNTEVTGGTTALNNMVQAQENALTKLEAYKAKQEALGKGISYIDTAIKRQEKMLSVVKATQSQAEATVLQSKAESSEIAKQQLQQTFSDFTAIQKQYQESLKAAMDSTRKQAAEKLAPGVSIDMTEGMEEGKARFIQNWMEAKDSVKTAMAEIPNEISAQITKITVPTDNWNNSIFAMKGTFVQAVDEMAVKLNSEFSTEKNVIRFSNVIPPAVKESLTEFSTQVAAVGTSADAAGESLKKVFEPPADGDWGKVWTAMNEASTESANNVTKDWKSVWDNWLEAGTDNIESLNSQLNELIKDRSMTVTVKMVETKQLGGIIGGFANGGAIQAMANGGNVMKNMLAGGHLPGFGGGDRRLILGEDGEVMLNKFAVAKASPQTALAFNRMDFKTVVEDLLTRFPSILPGYVGGGMLSTPPAVTQQTRATNPESRYNSSFTFTDTNGQRGVVVGSEIDIKLLERAINKTNRFRSSNK